MITLVKPQVDGQGLAIDGQLPDQPAFVVGDRDRIRQVLVHLVSNAIKYTPAGRVLIGCRRRAAHLRIDVFDTGVGVPQDKQRDIFVEFHRLDQGARIARGLGLGLSIVYGIVRQSGGDAPAGGGAGGGRAGLGALSAGGVAGPSARAAPTRGRAGPAPRGPPRRTRP